VYSEFGFLNHSLVGFDNAPDYDRRTVGILSLVFLNHSFVGFDNAPDYDREDYGYAEYKKIK
jgi:hypothetical protein